MPDRPEWSKRDKLAFEREMLGLYVSDHPLAGLESQLAKHASTTIADVLVGGGRRGRRDRHDRRADHLACSTARPATPATSTGSCRSRTSAREITVLFLGKTYQEFSPALTNDAIVVVRGRVSVRDDGVNLHAVSHVHSGYSARASAPDRS